MNNIIQFISSAISDKADNIIFSVKNGRGNLLVKSNVNYWESHVSSTKEDSLVVANSFSKLFEEEIILHNRNVSKIFNINGTNYKIAYQLVVTDENNFNIWLKIKNTNKILFNRHRVETPTLLLLEKILGIAIEKDVSDIHIQIRDYWSENQVEIMFRAHGELLDHDVGNITLQQGYGLCKTMHNITENKETNNNETEDFMSIFYKSIHYSLGDNLYNLGVGVSPCHPSGLDMIIRVLPVDSVFLE